jgi:hypothetical protein
LLFRVKDTDGKVHPDSVDEMRDNVFGTGNGNSGDKINLKTQLAACSVGGYTVVPGAKAGFEDAESASGVIDITLDISLDNPRATVRNAVLAKAREVMANKTELPVDTSLTTYADHTMFSLEKCHQECGWAAYASVGSYYQVRELAAQTHRLCSILLTKRFSSIKGISMPWRESNFMNTAITCK